MRHLTELFVFAHVVDHGGFTAAARRLRLPKSTVSKRVSDLEQRFGATLIARTSRTFHVTDLGREVHRHAKAMIAEGEAAAASAERRQSEPMGVVRMTASAASCQSGLTSVLADLTTRLPRIQVVLHATNRYVDLVQEGFDLAVRAHRNPLPDSELVQRRIGEAVSILVASPDYLRRRGEPAAPEDLHQHDGLLNAPETGAWVVRSSERLFEARPSARLFADEPSTLVRAAMEGFGIAALPLGLCRPLIDQGALRRVLPVWSAGATSISLVMPYRRGVMPSVRAAADHFVETLPTAMTLAP
ncbi:LysR substrate-binding domain-containing protein [Phenylobacterium terrae]|uniref:LysR substrate-binding domain-containing protein n=1 Tax=Phenylobacterium terrae TaxID=2665495 RepID=A0ABW4N6Z7_9CAUL